MEVTGKVIAAPGLVERTAARPDAAIAHMRQPNRSMDMHRDGM
jgi:hypothetical protein